MWNWLIGQDWSLENVSELLAMVAILVGAVLAMIREPALRPWRWASLLAGMPERRYAKKFETRWGRYENRYLKPENLDFRRTYIPVALEGVGLRARASAIDVLAARELRAITVIGEPGSGKSTLLRAYGVEMLRRHRPGGRAREIPFLVQLRRFAAAREQNGLSLAEYVITGELAAGLQMSRADGTRLFSRALRRDRAVLLLDGLDEVPQRRQESVLQAVADFRQNLAEELPTGRARVILTCRQQNFTSLREKWEPVMRLNIFPTTSGRDEDSYQLATIAPLTDAEIGRYLRVVRSEFRDQVNGPQIFLSAVRRSGTMELHRVPLVLSMSVGLYADKAAFDIPSEKARLYQQMVTEMLQRHSFRDQPNAGLLNYTQRDKRWFLRKFALANADAEAGCGEPFGEFPRQALDRFATAIIDDFERVTESDVAAFVSEIIDHSGLLARVNDEDTFTFAHRSIQEHLVAEELRTRRDGAELLLRHTDQTQWRQVFTFYVGTDEQSRDSADAFLTRLAELDLALAGSCVAAAAASRDVATRILTRLAEQILADEQILRVSPDSEQPARPLPERDMAEQRILVNLAALLDAAQSLRQHVAALASELVPRVLERIIGLGAVFKLLGSDLDNVAMVIEALVRSGQAEHVAAMAPKVSDAAPTDARLVGPLWRCLAVPGMVDQPGTERIVERLLTMVMDRTCFKELAAQDRIDSDFITDELRRTVYPFTRGLPRDSNLVTLLCWAERLQVEPTLPNRYFAARREDRARFTSVEDDHQRMPRISLWRTGRILSAAGFGLASLMALYWLLTDWHVLTRPSGLHTLWWFLAPTALVAVAFAGLTTWAARRPDSAAAYRYLRAGAAPDTGRSGSMLAHVLARRLPDPIGQLLFLLSPTVYGLALAPLLTVAEPLYFVLALITQWLLGWMPLLAVFDRGESFYLYRPNPYDDMYDDERSRHWITPDVD